MKPHRVLLGVTGGIAACKAPALVRRLRDAGYEVRCALTRAGASFVTPLTLEVLSGYPVYREEYLSPGVAGEEEHVAAAAWADLLLIAPATAHTLARLSLGLADDFLSTLALVYEGPVAIAPAMHSAMWQQEAVQRHVDHLSRRGVRWIGPVEGPLASGETGLGRMAEPEEIVAAVVAETHDSAWRGRRVVVAAGPTREPLDPVRYLSNRSSGRMGFALAEAAARRGAEVTLVAGPVALTAPPGVERVDVESAEQMRGAVIAAAAAADMVIMAAAVADFRPRSVASQKLKKQQGVPVVELEPTADILAELATAAPDVVRVGFAAETTDVEAAARGKLAAKQADWIIANDVGRSDIGFGSELNEVIVFGREREPIHLERQPKRRLAERLLDLFAADLERREPKRAAESR